MTLALAVKELVYQAAEQNMISPKAIRKIVLYNEENPYITIHLKRNAWIYFKGQKIKTITQTITITPRIRQLLEHLDKINAHELHIYVKIRNENIYCDVRAVPFITS